MLGKVPGLIARIDGGARANPGPAGFGVSLEDGEGRQIAALSGYLGTQTNNVAEYAALLAALQYAIDHGASRLAVFSDSELLVRQINGQYRVKNPVLQRLHRSALDRMRRLERVTISHVRREQNQEADRLANRAMDSQRDDPEGIAAGLLE